MAIDITTRGTARINPIVEFGGAQIRAQYRQLATVITVRGRIDATNVDQLSEHARRFVLAKEPLVLDLSGVTSFAAAGIWLLCVLDGDCHAAGVDWTLIESASVHELLGDFDEDAMFPTSLSVDQALHALADGNDQRRQMLLPLIKKSA
ncbi:STAS domain-containing protein [Mycolicibacter minnesotensis]|uniref:STAS domain-containing protein n=1 Tax=Mycolicibacter minnesotensis TaxID=1118379 RepID=A0A7I7RA52_9MYCO|nr:STAS domain-containing protein [Mycolicibacter minnesotensis]ORB03161.1 STAS domain-containing protein [Mycolicibacter minnesotensis]BBY35573.1 sulfate transporter [Mycolicibacter minnesotensis]